MTIKSGQLFLFGAATAAMVAVCPAFAHAAEKPTAVKPAPEVKIVPEKAAAGQPVQPADFEKETQRLIDDMVKRGIAAKADVAEIGGKSVEDMAADYSYQDLERLKKKVQKPGDHVARRAFRKQKLREGDMKYRVAVSDGVITLKEAQEIGLANNIQLKASRRKIDVARSKVSEARRGLFPTAQVVMEWNGGKAQGSPTNLGGRLYKGKNYKFNVTQPVFYGGELVFTVKQADANLKTAIEEDKKSRGEYLAQVTTAYLGLVKTEYNFSYQMTLFDEMRVIYNRIKEERKKKLIADIDYLNAESAYYSSYYQLESSKADLSAQRLILFQTMFLAPDDEVPVDMKLDFREVHPELEELIELALRNSPDVRIKEYALESAELGLKIAKAKRLPKIDARGSYGMLGEVFKDTTAIESDNHDLDTEKEWFLGFGASMPVGPNSVEYEVIKHHYGPTILALTGSEDWSHEVKMNLFDKLPDITDGKNAEATYLTAIFELEKARNDVIVKVKDEFYNMKKALIQIDAAVAKMRYQDKQVTAYRYLVSVQEQTVAALFEGLTEQASAKFSFIQAVADYHLAVAALNVAIGDVNYLQSQP